MLKCVIRRTAVVLSGSAVVVSTIGKDESKGNWWSDLSRYFFPEEDSFSGHGDRPKESLSGWDRLYIMYTRDEYGNLSKELNSITYCFYTSFFFGAIYGVVTKTKKAHNDFIQNNQATQFANIYEARRALQDKVMLAAFKGMFYQGGRIALFTGSILTMTISLMVYSNYTSVIHYGIAGGFCGAVHKWKMGPRGILVGGLVGGSLGLLGGALTKGLFYITGGSFNDVISYQDDVIQQRNRLWKETTEKALENDIEGITLLQEHDKNNENTTDNILD